MPIAVLLEQIRAGSAAAHNRTGAQLLGTVARPAPLAWLFVPMFLAGRSHLR